MRITYVGYWNALTGYGRAARDNVAALVQAGHDVTIVDWQSMDPKASPSSSPEDRYDYLDARIRAWSPDVFANVDGIVYHGKPRVLAATAAQGLTRPRTLAMTTWETSRFPDEYAAELAKHYGAVAVPSSWCRDVVADALDEQSVGEYPVAVVPHGFDPDFWSHNSGIALGIRDGAFITKPPRRAAEVRFYALGAWSERKNMDAILRAYLHAFTAADDVSLTIRSPDVDVARVQSLLARSGLPPRSWPKVIIPAPAPMSEVDLYTFHHEHDVFVSASRGEGWGLGAFEAAVMGNRIITPMGTGEDEFLRAGDSHYRELAEVESSDAPCFAGEGPMVVRDGKVAGVTASLVHGVTCKQLWREVDVVDLAQEMVLQYQRGRVEPVDEISHEEEAGYFGRASLEQRFAYPAVATALTHALELCR